MADFADRQELNDRLNLIETMIAEGRQKTESWGWTFVLWGIAYYVAIAWATWGHSPYAWPVTMVGTSILTAVIASLRGKREPDTTIGRSIGAIWIGLGCSLFILCMSTALSGRAEQHVFLGMIEAMLWRGQRHLGHHSQMEGAICLRYRLVGSDRGPRSSAPSARAPTPS